jgi:AcrR family transcriptional regulator
MSRTGRPREFDRVQAVHNAMRVFWERGYENATLLELQEAMGGITAPSFYNAFGSKENLFREVVAVYAEQEGSGITKALSKAKTARAAIESMFREAIKLVASSRNPKGCLVALGGINCSEANSEITHFMQELRRQRAEIICSRLKRGVSEGDLPTGFNVIGLADYITTVLDGICLQAKDGASPKKLSQIAELAMSVWDATVENAAAKDKPESVIV